MIHGRAEQDMLFAEVLKPARGFSVRAVTQRARSPLLNAAVQVNICNNTVITAALTSAAIDGLL